MSGREYKVEYPQEVQFCVPDGMWVAEASDGPQCHYHRDYLGTPYETFDTCLEIIGAPAQRTQIWVSHNCGPAYEGHPAFSSDSYKWLYIACHPFGIITTPTRDGQPYRTRRYFTPARQIHKGELGMMQAIEMPKAVQTLKDKNGDEGYSHSQKQIGWVRLDELSIRARLLETELLKDYYPFNDFVSTLLPMVIATAPEDFEGRVVRYPQRRDLRLDEAIKMVLTHPTGYVWVRASFAAIVLRLHRLGYKPEAT